ncbi:hypothetical protein [Aureimonas leprariae]|uniref:Uncharacterized protein n=1 Tax=Plantimonas leprariae TaxID=2615207 RepID=A0A7V7PPY6_9HYPH|nr:hypothetical protein [Aureimonas leprariae]KAB0680137.1 hypothetical protein F6X38_10050 [Aureimonas leprariae]
MDAVADIGGRIELKRGAFDFARREVEVGWFPACLFLSMMPESRHGSVAVGWHIQPFIGMGALRFGMSPSAVADLIGAPERTRARESRLREFREVDRPILTYDRTKLVEIEAFYDVPAVTYQSMDVFGVPGLECLQTLEAANGGALHNVGVVLFAQIGLTCGRLDEETLGDHSITAFARGLWDGRHDRFKPITFLR